MVKPVLPNTPQRRARDEAALSLMDALDANADVSRKIIPLASLANLPIPLTFSIHPRPMLLQLVLNAGAALARSLETSLEAAPTSDTPESKVEGLSQSQPFRTFVTLKMQALEGSQVSGCFAAHFLRGAYILPLFGPLLLNAALTEDCVGCHPCVHTNLSLSLLSTTSTLTLTFILLLLLFLSFLLLIPPPHTLARC